MDNSFLKEQADRCRRAPCPDRRSVPGSLDLAERYEDKLERPSRATRSLVQNSEARLQDRAGAAVISG